MYIDIFRNQAIKKVRDYENPGLFWRRHPDLNWGIKVLQTSALPLGYGAVWKAEPASVLLSFVWSGRRGSNSLPPPWQGGALPDELRPHIRGTGVILVLLKGGASDRNRTNDTGIFSPLLYRLSYRGAPDDDYYTRNSGFVKRKLQIFLKKIRLFLKKAFERGIL